MEHIGTVVSIEGELATLQVKRVSGCASNCNGCAASCDEKTTQLTLPNIVGAKVGDSVEIEMDTSFIIKSMIRVYGIPLALFMITIALSSKVGVTQVTSFVLGILSFVLSFFILRILDKKESNVAKAQIIRILN